ncbi:Fe(3+)-hydroxamate ABC transporter permease FhuB [Paludibacterium purpuratum]|uniref:Iron complex transport system permease protein n=1 Tax=Paludibacterium purpuratum TaxID=1144873 RepID=A0A4R7BCT0_9NEIS|nr:Fe(3+)-hydroxamate ABC transporter permease FhuB [Paludibacterium purpuratum]TDR82854.1 iron complex transport system permease protein [Paludibacterium purpuratum]
MSALRWRRGPLWLALPLMAALVWFAAVGRHYPARGDLGWLWRVVRDGPGTDLDAVLLYYGTLPRLAMALVVGATLGLSGCLLQQLSGNVLLSPMTLGSASGAWLAMIAGAVWWPWLSAHHPDWLAMGGAVVATGLLLLLTGRHRLGSLQLVLAGMALNILLAALATALTLLHDQYALGLFVWGAGDLAQYDWHWLPWLAARLLPPLMLLPLLARPLALLRLGLGTASGRGLALLPALLAILLLSLWLSAVAVAAVGLIGFISVLTPALARRAGARTIAAQWGASAALGALLLCLTDGLAQLAAHWSSDSVPSGAAAALIGAPALVWLLGEVRDPPDPAPAVPAVRLDSRLAAMLWFGFVLLAASTCLLTRDAHGWCLAWPEAIVWWLRWPRLLAAGAAGAGLGVAGVILQRLLNNPLASPDLLGISAGATLALLLSAGLAGVGLAQVGWLPALVGSVSTLALVLWLGRRFAWRPSALVLAGLALSALLDGMVQFVLARGGLDTVATLAWLAGSTNRVEAPAALALALGVGGCALLAWLGRRSLTLLAAGDALAVSCGLSVSRARAGWLLLAALLCALVTSLVGPIGFVGVLMPHLAIRLGARAVGAQLLAAAAAGALSMLIADALGRTLLYPMQLPVGLCAGLLCGTLLVLSLSARRGGRS